MNELTLGIASLGFGVHAYTLTFMKSLAQATLSKTVLASDSISSVVLYLWEKWVSKSFPTRALFAMAAACPAVRCLYSLAFSSRLLAYVDSHMSKSESCASSTAARQNSVSIITVTFFPFVE